MSKKRILRIGIASHADIQRRTLDIARGKLKPKPSDPDIWFTSPTVMNQVFSELNMMLIEIIRDNAPGSVRELADLARSKRPNVARALKLLEQYNVIDFVVGTQGRKAPRLLHDVIDMRLDLRSAA